MERIFHYRGVILRCDFAEIECQLRSMAVGLADQNSERKMMFRPPYTNCPYCGEKTFGVANIFENRYTRKCNSCSRPKGHERGGVFPLPAVKKKVIYLDQNAISDMMKSINPSTKAFKKGTVNEYWRILLGQLDTLVKMQLVICPYSSAHEDESATSPYFRPLKKLYEQLSHGLQFNRFHSIQMLQVCAHAGNWIRQTGAYQWYFDVRDIVPRKIDVWHEHFIISLHRNYIEKSAPALRASREGAGRTIESVWRRWQGETNRKFDDWYREEAAAYGRSTLKHYAEYLKQLADIQAAGFPTIPNPLEEPLAVDSVIQVAHVFESAGHDQRDALQKTEDYFSSASLSEIPWIHISSCMCAALARRAASGRKKPPSRGFLQDIQIISTLLPYCDAIFLDKECHSIIEELKSHFDYPTKVFSLRNKEDFLEYLEGIEQSATEEQLCALEEVYGSRRPEPYLDMFDDAVI